MSAEEVSTPASVAPEDQIEKPNENDVLCGRGGSINSHTGNEQFRRLVEARKRIYLTARFKREKRLIASSIVSEIRQMDPPGRFLAKRGPKSAGYWYDIGDEKARDKTSQALRENAPSIRAEIESEVNLKRKKEGKEVKKMPPTPASASSSHVGSASTSASPNKPTPVPAPSAPPASPPERGASTPGSAPSSGTPPQHPPPPGPHGYYSPHAAAWADYYARYARYYGHYPPHPPPPPPPGHHHYPGHHYPPHPGYPPYLHHSASPHHPPPQAQYWGPPPQPPGSVSSSRADESDQDKKPAATPSASAHHKQVPPFPQPPNNSSWSVAGVAQSKSDEMDDASDYSSDAHELDVDDEVENAASLSPRRQQEEQDREFALSLHHQEQMSVVEARRRRHDDGPRSRRTSRSSAYAPYHSNPNIVGLETYAPLASPAPVVAAAAAVPPATKPKATAQEERDHKYAVALQVKEDSELSRQRKVAQHSSRRSLVSSAYSQVKRHHLDDWGATGIPEEGAEAPTSPAASHAEREADMTESDVRERQIQPTTNQPSGGESSVFSQVASHILGSLGSWDPNNIMCTDGSAFMAQPQAPQVPPPLPAPGSQMAMEPEGHEVQLMDVRDEMPPPAPVPQSREMYGRLPNDRSWDSGTGRAQRSLADPSSVSIFHSTSNQHHNAKREDSMHSQLNSTIGSFGAGSSHSSHSGRDGAHNMLNAYNRQVQQLQNYGISPANSMDMTMDGSSGTSSSVGGGSLLGVFDKDLSISNHMPHPRVLQQVPSWERSMRSKSPGFEDDLDDSHVIRVRGRLFDDSLSRRSLRMRFAPPELSDPDDSMQMDWEGDHEPE